MNHTNQQETEGRLGLFDAVSIIVGIVIGTSIFQVPWLIFGSVTDPWMGLTVWALGGALALVGALCYSELATTYPKAGGDYFYLTRAYRPWVGFLFGWAQLVVVFAASIGAMTFVFGENATALKNLNEFVDLTQINADHQLGITSEFAYAALAVLVLSLLNIVGVVFGKWTQNILTIAKVVGLVAILIAGIGWAQSSPLEWRLGREVVNDAGKTIRTIGWSSLAIILVLYAYGGWNDAAFVAAEVRDQRRNIPLALILGVGLITFIYLAVNAAYLMGLGFEEASKLPDFRPEAAGTFSSLSVPGRVVERAFEGWGGRAMSIIIMVSALGAVNGLIFTGARVYATLGNDYTLFGWLGQWQPGRRAPILSLLVQAVITIGIIFALGTERGHQLINQLLGYIGVQPEGPWRGWPCS